MASHIVCGCVVGHAGCTTCRRNPIHAHPFGDWRDDWQQPVIDTAAPPASACKSREAIRDLEVGRG